MKYTIGQAAKATGRSKSLISKAIKDGKISATRLGSTPTSPMEIEASELFRVFSPVNTIKNDQEHPENTQETPTQNTRDTSNLELATALEILKVERKYQEQRIDDLKAQLSETKEDNDNLRTELRSTEVKLIGVLENMSNNNSKQGLLKRLFGGAGK